MALTKGMLERFQNIASNEDTHLLKVNLSEGKPVHGYLREVGEDFFVLEEVQPVGKEEVRKSIKTTLALNLITSWSEISPTDVPRYYYGSA
jgi:hypothetical protein